MRKHVDAIALAAIIVGFLAYSTARNAPALPKIDRIGTRINQVVDRIEIHGRQVLERVRLAVRP